MNSPIATIPMLEIAAFCQQWKVRELAVFGSIQRDDFGPSSDVDLLITFAEDADWGLLQHIRMQRELETMLHRKVDLITKRAVEGSQNWLRRQEILNTAHILFAAGEAAHATG